MFHWVFADGTDERSGWHHEGNPAMPPRTIRFRSWRGGGRWHAACDLVVPYATPIRAVCDGTVQRFSEFYEGTWALEVVHEHPGYPPFTVRYGEVQPPAAGGPVRTRGERITGGDVIAHVGQLTHGGHMLHFELYAQVNGHLPLSLPRRFSAHTPEEHTDDERHDIRQHGWDPFFERRLDLCNPVTFLQALKRGEAPPAPQAYGSSNSAPPDIEYLTFTDEEAEPVVVDLSASRADTSQGGRRAPLPWCNSGSWRRAHGLPSWREAYMGGCEEELSDLLPPVSGGHGPDE